MKFFSTHQNRKYLPDLLKGIAVVLMIQVHITENFAGQEFFNSPAGKISLFFGGVPAAPLFMIVMGYFFAASRKSNKQNFIRCLYLLLGGFVLNIARSAYLFVDFSSEDFSTMMLPRILAVDIFPLAGLSLMIMVLLKKYFADDWYLYFLTALFAAFLGEILVTPNLSTGIEQYLLAFIFGNYATSFFPVIPWIAYPLTGAAFYLGRTEIEKYFLNMKPKILFLTAWILIIAVTFSFAFDISSTLGLYYRHGILFFLWASFFLAGIIWLMNFLPEAKNIFIDYLRWLGKNVTAVYVVQWLFVGNLAALKIQSNNFDELIFYFFAILISTTVVVLIWERIGNGKKAINE